ncbi:uncharacterized protein LOC120280155 [Dioscorea cayenensis subsp. rotundata]|uniref:Uncharacterized protein LOC120280155 n=1 Tax=Dioscorea cayennensis subsp. rotundata TaxID=55577 RepID=A0AB40CTT1_DIOCR|nr:uncharacterized protein LOC120280155 [Dioscorea cayenensis subsp. rotundata]
MEGNQGIKDQGAVVHGVSSGSKLRYPLRSATKLKEEKQAMAGEKSGGSSATRRGRPKSEVSKSVSVLDLSGKDKIAKVPGRLSFPSKSSPRPATSGSVTPISEARTRRTNTLGKSETPLSNVSRSSGQRRFNVLSSVSYWLTQIKLSESAGKHSISLGFFKLALEAGCEHIQRLREELKSYACRYNLVSELGESVKDLMQSYNILEEFEKLSISGSCSESPRDGGMHVSDEDVHNSNTTKTGNLKPKLVNSDALGIRESNKLNTVHKKIPTPRNKSSVDKNSKTVTSTEQKRSQRLKKPESNAEKVKIKSSLRGTPIPAEKVDSIDTSQADEEEALSQEEKENMDVQLMEQEIQTN